MGVKKNRRIIFLSLVVVIVIVIIGGIYQFKKVDASPTNTWTIVSNTKEIISDELIDSSEENNIYKLQSKYQNTDIKGIISIENEDGFVYPVVQTSDNEYYLNHNYDEDYDSLGAIYADYRVNLDAGRKVLIFGHSSVKRDVPFNKLENYYDEDYYRNHKYITLETETDTYQYEIFSVYVETSDFTYMNLNFDTMSDWYSHILKLQSKSLYDTDVVISKDDDILILQTCSNNIKYQNYSKKYLLIVSRRVK